MAKRKSGKEQAKAALKVLREIEKARLKIGAGNAAIPHFMDKAVGAVYLISDLAAVTLRRIAREKKS